jgi:hypothetical protein
MAVQVLPIPRELRQPQDEEKAKIQDLLTTRTGGAYIPPAKLRMMMQKVADKQSSVGIFLGLILTY